MLKIEIDLYAIVGPFAYKSTISVYNFVVFPPLQEIPIKDNKTSSRRIVVY